MNHCTLVAVGDVFLGDSPVRMGRGAGSAVPLRDWSTIAAGIRQLLGPGDCHFVNVETVLSHVGRRWYSLGSCEMRGHPRYAEFVADCGWNVANVANNHIFQHGTGAYEDTVRRLRDQGLSVIGCGGQPRSPEAVVASPIGPLTFAGYSMRPEQYHPGRAAPYALPTGEDDLLRQIEATVADAQGPVIVSLHWGYEFMDEPSTGQQRLARRICELGVRVLLGHHPHVVQGLEHHGDALIAYSLGNFVFDLLDARSRESVVLRVEIPGSGPCRTQLRPVVIGDDALPGAMAPEAGTEFLARIDELSRRIEAGKLKPDAELDEEMRRYYAGFSRGNYRHFFENLLTYNPLYSSQAILRAVLRRLGVVHDP